MQQRRVVIDQMGREIDFNYPPQRIISLVPSQTELLYDLGLENQIIGITKFCVHPKSKVKAKTKIGGTKKIRFDVIESLHPDLIIGNKEENDKENITALEKSHPVWMSDIVTLKDALWMINTIGEVTGKTSESNTINNKIVSAFKTVNKKRVRVLYLIWRNPWMGAGVETFIHNMLTEMGFVNVLQTARYPELTADQIKNLNPEYIFLSSEPYPFQEKHGMELKDNLPDSKISFVDGQMFSWYGSRLIQAPQYFNRLLARL
jgi:ABC-type Fe3+-hydroxamate transport system substrate-binding protein